MSGLPPPEYSNSEDLKLTSHNSLKDRTSQQIQQQSSFHSESNENQTIDTNVNKDNQQQQAEVEQEEVKNGSYNPTDNVNIVYEESEENTNNSNNDNIDYENDMKLSMECMDEGQLPFSTFYEDLKFVKLSQYQHGIPTGLEGLKRRLIQKNGLNFEGIFRLRGKELNLNVAKEQLNKLETISKIIVTPIEVAQLIKAFYRNLPCDEPGYLPQSLLDAQTEQEIINEFSILSEPRKSLLLWTFDLWINIEEYKPKNKMTLQSMSIVFSPNMVRCLNPNPMVFLELQKKVQRVTHDAAKLRRENKLIIDKNYTFDNNIIPFKKDRSSKNEHASSQGPKYAAYNARNNNENSNGIAEFFKNCVLL